MINSLPWTETVSHLQLPLSANTLFPTLLILLFRMRFENLSPLAFFGLAASHAIQARAPAEAAVAATNGDRGSGWRPQTTQPHFFNLRVNDRCDLEEGETQRAQCPFDSYAIRLEKGILVATPYNRWWDPKLATFFVDDDTQMYTVSLAFPPRNSRPKSLTAHAGQQGTPPDIR